MLLELFDMVAAGIAVAGIAAVPGVAVGVPVVPMGVPCWLCWPAPVAGLATLAFGGDPCAKAAPANANAAAARKVFVVV